MPHYAYLWVDLGCLIFPLLFSFHSKIQFYKQYNFFIIPCLLTAVFFIIWDIVFTYYRVWSFNSTYVLGFYLFNLPFEEILFFVCIPYACVFTYYTINNFFLFYKYTKIINVFYWVLSITLFLVAIYNVHKLYTSVSFFLLSILLIVLLIRKVQFLTAFFISFVIILIPFCIANGILTGSFIVKDPIVLYNNTQNLGIRVWNIPLEDVFYGMLLLLMNVAGFELFRTKKILKE